jgi:DNA-binding beta-propeller fold protein YncE
MTYRKTAQIAVEAQPTPILYSNGSIWTANYGSASINRIDPATNTVTHRISSIFLTSKPVALAEDQFGNVWVACNDYYGGSVSRIDPATNTITASVATADGLNPIGLGMGAGELWASYNLSAGFYERFDTTTLLSTGSVGSTGYSYNFVDDGTHVWFDTGGSCKKVVPATNAITTITTGIVNGLGFLHYAFGYIWRVCDRGLQRVDPTTNALTRVIVSGQQCYGVTDDGTDLIVSDIGGEIYVVDPTSFTVKQTLTSTSYYWGTTFGGGSIWANARNSGQCKRFTPLPVGWVRGHAWG